MPRCPKCKVPLDRIDHEGVHLYDCVGCGGKLIDTHGLKRLLTAGPPLVPDAVKQKLMEVAVAADSRAAVWCWTCGKEMRRTTLMLLPQVALDLCAKCRLMWLDQGELERCRILWDEVRQTAQTAGGEELTARLALLDAQFEQKQAEREAADEAAE